jgi:hypothetical protein
MIKHKFKVISLKQMEDEIIQMTGKHGLHMLTVYKDLDIDYKQFVTEMYYELKHLYEEEKNVNPYERKTN